LDRTGLAQERDSSAPTSLDKLRALTRSLEGKAGKISDSIAAGKRFPRESRTLFYSRTIFPLFYISERASRRVRRGITGAKLQNGF
jgi:hypothetical protein